MNEGPGWTIVSIIQHQLVISETAPVKVTIKNSMKGLINIQNKDNECFRWFLVRYLTAGNKNPPKIRNVDKEFAK